MAYANHLSLDILALTETNHSFSHTSHTSGRGGRTGLLISNKWKYNQLLPNAKYNTFGGNSTQALLGRLHPHTCRIPSVSSPKAEFSHVTAAMS